MKILVIGWYGTETIGDRAILAGLIQLLTKKLGAIDLILGSLYPFFSKRTIYEDKETIQKTAYAKVNFSIIDTRNSFELKKSVNEVDLVIMGGGPLMDLSELYMIDYAFKLAKKKNKKTAIMGCGIGPLFNKKYRKLVFSIIKNSDATLLRDESSKSNLKEIFQELSQDFNAIDIAVGFDPAVHYTSNIYRTFTTQSNSDYISINLRSFPPAYSDIDTNKSINSKLENFVKSVSERFSDKEILLTPMHYFHIGDDDRYFLNEIKFKLNKENIRVQNKPLSLEETLKIYVNAKFNIGMRFHSVVLQTIASGKNFVLDYTQPKKGKISGFINDIDKLHFYDNRHICLQEKSSNFDFDFSAIDDKFHFEPKLIEQSENAYLTQISKLNLAP